MSREGEGKGEEEEEGEEDGWCRRLSLHEVEVWERWQPEVGLSLDPLHADQTGNSTSSHHSVPLVVAEGLD